jgi:hypothetical protein
MLSLLEIFLSLLDVSGASIRKKSVLQPDMSYGGDGSTGSGLSGGKASSDGGSSAAGWSRAFKEFDPPPDELGENDDEYPVPHILRKS